MGISDGLFSKAKIVLGVGSVKGTSINDDRLFLGEGSKMTGSKMIQKLDIIYVRSLRVFLAFTRPILAKTEIICPKNVGALVAMNFT